MNSDTKTYWTISVSKETDISLRNFLAQRGLKKKGDLSKFVEDAVKWHLFDQTLAEVRDRFSDLSAESLQALADEAVQGASRCTNVQAS